MEAEREQQRLRTLRCVAWETDSTKVTPNGWTTFVTLSAMMVGYIKKIKLNRRHKKVGLLFTQSRSSECQAHTSSLSFGQAGSLMNLLLYVHSSENIFA